MSANDTFRVPRHAFLRPGLTHIMGIWQYFHTFGILMYFVCSPFETFSTFLIILCTYNDRCVAIQCVDILFIYYDDFYYNRFLSFGAMTLL